MEAPSKNSELVQAPEIESAPLKYWKDDQSGMPTITLGSGFTDGSTAMKDIAGVKDSDLALNVLFSAVRAIEKTSISTGVEAANVVIQTLHDLHPKDAAEARLIAQSSVLYAHAMKSFERAGAAEIQSHIESMSNLGIKLMRAHNETVETLSRYRRGGVQQVVVQYQNTVVANKAVVNNITGVGMVNQNQGESPCSSKNAEQKQEPTTINHADNRQWPMENADSMEVKAPVQKQNKAENA